MILSAAFDCLFFGWTWNIFEFVKNLIFLNAAPGLVSLPYNHVTWSLGFEFAFYLVVPGLLLLRPALGKRGAAIAAALVAKLLLPPYLIRANGLFLGAVIGSFEDASLTTFAKRGPLTAILLAYLWIGIFRGLLLIPYVYCYFPLLASAAILFIKIVWDRDCELHVFFSSRVLRWLGTISYSVYLFNPMTLELLLAYTPRPPSLAGLIVFLAGGLFTTILVAFCVYVVIERRYFAGHQPPKQSKIVLSTT